mgnify:CR=1 FL=1
MVASGTATATCDISAATSGSYTVTATYGGNAYFDGSSGTATLTATVISSTTTALTPASDTLTFGDTTTFTATVSPGTATGTVTFSSGGTTLCASVTVSGGTATCDVSTLAPGSHSITASFDGAGVYGDSTSSAASLTVIDGSCTTLCYVSPSGSDGITATGSPVNPYLTIQHALDQVGTNGTVSVAAGTYDETIAISKSGITLTGAGAGSVIMGQAVSGATGGQFPEHRVELIQFVSGWKQGAVRNEA